MKKCFFCKYNSKPNYLDIENIWKFISPRMKIINRENTGVCAKHQRTLTKHIKYARYLGLLPFVSYKNNL